jgi:hypothetical protein
MLMQTFLTNGTEVFVFDARLQLEIYKMRVLPSCVRPPACLSVRPHENRWTDFYGHLCRRVLVKFIDTFQFWLKSDN